MNDNEWWQIAETGQKYRWAVEDGMQLQEGENLKEDAPALISSADVQIKG